ncbi:interleukin-10 receptor subunit beta-like isoform X2 [Syngnathoides biaculeatus]|uniref:interleukin-10 receptor subunit beta-like isoform X2 n=1 Tax=Syngnathoides biaculeatus TaxID=300417 RepID=UPI002ADD4F91|nr:interleukin-10 receptor subunit beta-like isoform X2 [Syngnathoides biaculeatus]
MSSLTLNVAMVFLTLAGATVVVAVLSAPRNVQLSSMNMNLVLRWDSPEGESSDLIFTTECTTSVRTCPVGCVNISTHECDFSSFNTSLSVYGRYRARVRAQRGAESSSWVESDPITLDSETIIGAPNVWLFSHGATIEIAIKDPEFAMSDFRSIYSTATYNITFWKDGQNKKTKSISCDRRNRVFLNDLERWSNYCVQVQITAEGNTKPSKPSSTVCERTTSVAYRRRASYFLCPEDQVPQTYSTPHHCEQVRLGDTTSSTCTITTGAPHGCVFSPLLFSLYTNDCISWHPTVQLLKFADDTTVIGLIKDGNECAYRQEVVRLELWCGQHKTVEMIVNFRRHPSPQLHLTLSNCIMSTIETFKFFRITVSEDLKWGTNINSILKMPSKGCTSCGF